MAKQYFLSRSRAEQVAQNALYADTIGTFATKYGIAAPAVAALKADATAAAYWKNLAAMMDAKNKEVQAYYRQLVDGLADAEDAPAAVPAALAFPTPIPAGVLPGTTSRFASSAKSIKAMANYAEADGYTLGIEGADTGSKDMDAVKPTFSATLTAGGKIKLIWKKDGMNAIDFYVDRGDGTWQFIGTDTTPDFLDKGLLPPAGTSAIWKYKAIYKEDEEHVGLWSDVVSVTVAGVL